MTFSHTPGTARRRLRRSGLRTAVVATLTLSTALLAACGGSSEGGDSAGGGSNVTLRGANGDPSNGVAGAPFGSMQIQEGLDKEAGYKLEWDVAASAAAALQLLSAGKLEIAQTAAPVAYAAAKIDPDIRIVGFLNGPEYTIVAPEGSGITSAADLKGKTVGVVALGSSSQLMVQGSMSKVGLNPTKDVSFLPVGVGAPMAQAIDSGTIDAIAGWEGMWQSISALTKTPLAPVKSEMSAIPGIMAVASSQKVIDEHPEELQAWLGGFYKMCALAAVDPKRAVENHWKQFTSIVPPASEKDKRLANLAEWHQDFYDYCAAPSAETGKVGSLSDAEVQKAYQFFRDNNIVEDDVDVKTIVDTSLVDKALEGVDVKAWAKEYAAKG
jgi:NitT/TauT family transport system substrate-binding protein